MGINLNGPNRVKVKSCVMCDEHSLYPKQKITQQEGNLNLDCTPRTTVVPMAQCGGGAFLDLGLWTEGQIR